MPRELDATNVTWIPVPGGVCLFGDAARPRLVTDLLVAATPLTYRQIGQLGPHRTADLPEAAGPPGTADLPDAADLPVTDVDQAQAGRWAAAVGGRLPTSVEWEWLAAGPHRRTWPWGDDPWTPGHAQLRGPGSEPTGPGLVGGHPAGRSPQGLHDLAGTVWEWTASPVLGGGFVIRGGSYACPPLYARCTFLNAVHAQRRSPGIGVRPVRTA